MFCDLKCRPPSGVTFRAPLGVHSFSLAESAEQEPAVTADHRASTSADMGHQYHDGNEAYCLALMEDLIFGTAPSGVEVRPLEVDCAL